MIIYNGQVSHGVFWRGERVFDFNPTYGWGHIITITDSNHYTIPSKYKKIGLFLVGGGGGGAGDGSSANWAGSGGDGGQVKSIEIDNLTNNSIQVIVGAGGKGGSYKVNVPDATNGGDTSVTIDGVTYTALGGRRGGDSNTCTGIWPTTIPNSARGGCSRSWTNNTVNLARLNGRAGEGDSFVVGGTTYDNSQYANGGYGLPNPFDKSDVYLYGAGGGGGANAYAAQTNAGYQSLGGNSGGGAGGYGVNNATTNKGQDATFYGGGGGGGAFSSNHTNSGGGKGYQGIVIIYGWI